MRPIAPFLGVLIAVAGVVGCGSSRHSSSSTGGGGGALTAPASTSGAGSSTAPASGAGSASRSGTSTGAQSAGATTASGGSPGGGSGTTGATNVRIPATFTIRKGPSLDPSMVSVPAFIAIQLTLISGDGASHRVVVLASTKRTLTVPAGGRTSIMLPGLKAGRYVIDVDGSGGGALLAGAEPGP